MTDDAPSLIEPPARAAFAGPPALPLHLMIDIETLDTAPTALVLSAGWAWFDTEGILSSGHVCFDHELQQRGQERTISASTVHWWKKQPAPMPESRHGFDVRRLDGAIWATFPYTEPASLSAAMPDVLVWANSPSFDCVILRHWASRLRHALPWAHWQERDFRTFRALCEAAAQRNPSELLRTRPQASHNAEQDARDQAQFMIDNKHLVQF
jgi:hypothetical protein